MTSQRRLLASRANGARSRGPVTPEGKRRSSQNATKHGLLARCVVLSNESTDGFDDLVNSYIDRFQPADELELGMVEEMAANYWRLRRAWAIQNGTLQKHLDNQP